MISEDTLMITPFLNQLQEKIPKLVSGAIDLSTTGHDSLFASNEMTNLRRTGRHPGEPLPQYYLRCLPDGNIKTYFIYKDIPPSQCTEGQLNPLGEMPEVENYMELLYSLRHGHNADYKLTTDYLGLSQLYYAP